MKARPASGVEWPTLVALIVCYAAYGVGTTWLWSVLPVAGVAVTAMAIAFHSSLQHEVIHGHPFRSPAWNAALVFPALTLVIPLARFRDTHLAHHMDSILTDPYDDPESNYLDGHDWESLPVWRRRLHEFNNTLAGRLLIGPLLAQVSFMAGDLRLARAGDTRVLRGWLWHLPAMALVLAWIALAPMPLWAYLVCAYAAISILKIRTFLEHQAHERARGRTVIVEDRGPLALMFLNNNLHVVHHMHPRVPWYRLPDLYAANRARYLGCNGGYMYRSYAEVFRKHFLRRKDPVPHPLWRRG